MPTDFLCLCEYLLHFNFFPCWGCWRVEQIISYSSQHYLNTVVLLKNISWDMVQSI